MNQNLEHVAVASDWIQPRRTWRPGQVLQLNRLVAVALAVVGVGFAPMRLLAASGDWPGWRGTTGGAIPNDQQIPVDWNGSGNVAWKQQIPGKGVSSPIASAGRVFVTTATEGRDRTTTKRILWVGLSLSITLALSILAWSQFRLLQDHPPGSDLRRIAVRSTAINVAVFAAFMSGVLLCEWIVNTDSEWAHRMMAGSRARIWLASSCVAVLGALSAMLLGHHGTGTRILVMIAASALGGFLLLSEPDPSKWVSTTTHTPEIFIASLGIGTGAAARTRHARACLAFACAVYVALACLALHWHVTMNHQYCSFRYRIAIGCLVGTLVGSFLYRALTPSGPFWHPVLGRSQGSIQKLFYPSTVLLAVLLQFIGANHVLPSYGVMRELLCLDAESGRVAWRKGIISTKLERIVPATSYATPTPVTDGKIVCAYFGNAGAFATDLEGRFKWINRDLPLHSPYGGASSPVMHSNLVFIVADGLTNSYVVALNSETGAVVWKTERRENIDSYATPVVGCFGGEWCLVVAGAGYVRGYDLNSGTELWSTPFTDRLDRDHAMVVQSTVIVGDTLLVGGAYRNSRLRAFRVNYRTGWKVEKLWETRRFVLGYPSPLVVGEIIYCLNTQGILSAVRLVNGEVIWQERLPGPFSASPIGNHSGMLLFNDEGKSFLLPTDGSFRIIAKNGLREGSVGSPGAHKGTILVRTSSSLVCIRNKMPSVRLLTDAQ